MDRYTLESQGGRPIIGGTVTTRWVIDHGSDGTEYRTIAETNAAYGAVIVAALNAS